MKLYARRSSSNCQKVLWLLGELGLEYELVPTGGDAGGLMDPEYLALNPNGRVPTWVDGQVVGAGAGDGVVGGRGGSARDTVQGNSMPGGSMPGDAVQANAVAGNAVWESHAILRYLAARYAPERFWPADPVARSQIDRWMDWSQAQLDRCFMELFWGYWRTPVDQRDAARNLRNVRYSAHYLSVLDRTLAGHAFVVGDALSLADVPVGALMYRYANLGITEPLPENVARWYARLTDRPAFREHVMLPFDDLKGRLAF